MFILIGINSSLFIDFFFQKIEERIPITYYSVIPAVPELNADRKLEPLRLREMRKRLENDEQHSLEDIESVALECMDEIVELCSGKYN